MVADSNTTDATLTEYLAAADPGHPYTEGPCKVEWEVSGLGRNSQIDVEELPKDPDEYRVECSCGETFGNWGAATRHAEGEH
jgi:hypothetical protein